MADCVPFWVPGESITAHAGAAVTGRRFCKVSGVMVGGNPAVIPAVAGDRIFGVTARDKAINEKVLVFTADDAIVEVDAGAAITAGQAIQSDAAGKAIPLAAGILCGYAVDDTANAGVAKIQIRKG